MLLFNQTWDKIVQYFWSLRVGFLLGFCLLICSGVFFPAGQHMLGDEEELFCILCYSFGLEIPGKPLWGWSAE